MPRPLPSLAASSVRSICLTPGQTLRIWMPAGATLLPNGPGMSVVGAPQWIAGQLLQQRQILGEGQSLVLEQAGWVQIDAIRGGELLCMLPTATHWPARLAQVTRQLAGRVRSACRGKVLSGVSKSG